VLLGEFLGVCVCCWVGVSSLLLCWGFFVDFLVGFSSFFLLVFFVFVEFFFWFSFWLFFCCVRGVCESGFVEKW